MIEVKGLTKYYADWPAIQDVTFSVPRGQVLGFLGPNGAGKSTTMRILTGYISASDGTASIDGYDVFQHSVEVRRRVGYLPEMTPLYDDMRVDGFLELMCRLRGVPPSLRKELIASAIESCGLTERRHDIIGRLSRGLRQRVGLAQAVVHDPEVLILDEPTSGLDPSQTRDTRELIVELGRRHTVILSSHILPEVSATCERVVIINQGVLVADDTPDQLANRLSQGRGREVELIVRGDQAEISRRLRQVEGVTGIEVYSLPEGASQVIVASVDDIRERLAWEAVAAGFGLRELRTRTLSLEQIFLQLTTEEESDAG